MYGLREIVVAVGSVQLLAKELTHAKGKIQSLLPNTAARSVDNYFGRTVDATEDLRESAFRNVARRMLHAVFDPEKGIAMQIAMTNYDIQEPPESHSAWAHILGEHISRFSEVLDQTKLPAEMVVQVSTIDALWERSVRKCDGRCGSMPSRPVVK